MVGMISRARQQPHAAQMRVQQQGDAHAEPELREGADAGQQERVLERLRKRRDLEDHAVIVQARVIERHRAGLQVPEPEAVAQGETQRIQNKRQQHND